MKYLVVVDIQNDFVDGSLGTKEAQGIVLRVVEKIKGFDGQVIVTYDTHSKDYLSTQEGTKLPVEHCIEGTHGWELNSEVAGVLPEDAIYIKKRAMGSVELPEMIRACGTPESIEFVGLCTDACVISNALICKANFIEIPIMVDADCCAGVTVEGHDAAIKTMQMCQVSIQ